MTSVKNKLSEHDGQFDFLAKKILEHDDRFEKIDEKLTMFREEFLSGQDYIMKILKRLDDDRAGGYWWIKKIETAGEKNTKDIHRIKVRIKMA